MNELLSSESETRDLATVGFREVNSELPEFRWGGGNKAKRRITGMRMAAAGFAFLASVHNEIENRVPDSCFGFQF